MSAGVGRAVSLSSGGIFAALAVGAIALLAGWRWAALLLPFFAAATAVSRYRADIKARRVGGLLEKTGPRDAIQVLANGAGYAMGLLAFSITEDGVWAAFAAGALACASSDTWATELGLLSRHPPRSIVTGKVVQPGASGGVTLAGTLAGVLGALVVAISMLLLDIGSSPIIPLAGGVAGMLADSVLGATIQERWLCPVCNRATERRLHCGAATALSGGVRGLSNDAVNALATVVGGAVAVASALALS